MRRNTEDYTTLSIYKSGKSKILQYKPSKMSDADFIEEILSDEDMIRRFSIGLSHKHKKKNRKNKDIFS